MNLANSLQALDRGEEALAEAEAAYAGFRNALGRWHSSTATAKRVVTELKEKVKNE